MRTLLLFIISFLSMFALSQETQSERGPMPMGCILSSDTPHSIDETKRYNYNPILVYNPGEIFTWSQVGTASVNITYPNINRTKADVKLLSSGTLCLKIIVTDTHGNILRTCETCFDVCDSVGMEQLHDEIIVQDNGSTVTFHPTNSDNSLYHYKWTLQYNDTSIEFRTGEEIIVNKPNCNDKKLINVTLEIFLIAYPNYYSCKGKLYYEFEDGLCTGGIKPVDRFNIIVNSNLLKVIGENYKNLKIMVYDTNSNLVLNSKLKPEISLHNLNIGVHFYKIIDENNNVIKDGNFMKN